jgi:hypothetical protein
MKGEFSENPEHLGRKAVRQQAYCLGEQLEVQQEQGV